MDLLEWQPQRAHTLEAPPIRVRVRVRVRVREFTF